MVKNGYKQTEVGVIPDDWDVTIFKSICNVNQGLQIPISQRSSLKENGYIYITIQYLNSKKNIEYISNPHPSVICGKDDVLMTRTGNTGMVVTGVEGVFHNNFFKINYNKNLLIKDYLVAFLKQPKIKKQILVKAGASTIPDLNHKDFYSLHIILPTKTEQQNIATALGYIDGLIISLEKLLEKKEAIKQGAMQKLLEPKENWSEVILGKCGRLYGGLSGKSKKDFIDGNKPYIPFVNVMKNVVVYEQSFGLVYIASNESQNTIRQHDLLFNGSSETPEELGLCSAYMGDHEELYLNSFCFCYRLFDFKILHPLYLAYFCRSAKGRSIFQLLAQGATRHNLSKSNFKKIKFMAPSVEEQKNIAKTLSDMDMEIKQIENRISKAKNIKEGMMQQLLSGAIRLL